MLETVEELLELAKSGKRLETKERRHCIRYVLGTQPDITQAELSRIFHVTEGAIRKDIQKIREDRANRLTSDDIKLVIADIVMSFERQVRDIERSKSKCEKGSMTYLKHCQTIFDLEQKKVAILQELGFYPKNLGTMSVNKYEFKAMVTQGGAIKSGNVKDPEVIDAEIVQLQLPSGSIDKKQIEESIKQENKMGSIVMDVLNEEKDKKETRETGEAQTE